MHHRFLVSYERTLRLLTGTEPSSERLGRFTLWDIALISCRQMYYSAQPKTISVKKKKEILHIIRCLLLTT